MINKINSDPTIAALMRADAASNGQTVSAGVTASSRISAILVSYNTAELTVRSIEALWRELDPDEDEVIMVDNASADSTIAEVRNRWPEGSDPESDASGAPHQQDAKVRILENPINAGFGAANNLGMASAKGRFFLLINTDAFVEPGSIRSMIRKLESNADWGVVGPKLLNRDGSLQRSCFRFPEPRQAWREALGLHYLFADVERWPHDSDRSVDFVSGACFLLRREIYEQLGGFDERFFMYSEECDWQRRMKDSGWVIGFTPDAEVTHFGGGSNKGGGIHPEFFRSIDKYQLKHGGRLGLITFRMGMITGLLIRMPYRLARVCLGDWAGFSRSIRLLARQSFAWGCMTGQGKA